MLCWRVIDLLHVVRSICWSTILYAVVVYILDILDIYKGFLLLDDMYMHTPVWNANISSERDQWNKWNKSGFRPPLCTYRINWARRNSWGWWDDWDDTVLQTRESKFEAWRSEAEHATSRSRRLPTILTFTRGWGRNILFLSNRRDREPNPELWRERQRC